MVKKLFRMWIKIWKENHLIKDMVYENGDDIRRTTKVLNGLAAACEEWNISTPIWLDLNIRDFKRFDKCRFSSDNFIEEIDFEYLEIHVIEE
ncbi:MAG: hypothetical protein PUB67_02245 [Clostridiales bacterium]|nr:hypothetical protein [Clostridiales bacterium]